MFSNGDYVDYEFRRVYNMCAPKTPSPCYNDGVMDFIPKHFEESGYIECF